MARKSQTVKQAGINSFKSIIKIKRKITRLMPSVHNDFAVYGRTKGYSAIAAAAYATRSKLWDDRQQKFIDYSNHPDKCLHSEIIVPNNSPPAFKDRETLWNTVEKQENRKDAQLCRRVILGLPHEISHTERIELLRGYIQEQFISKGMIADLSLHAPDKDGDQRNFHAHILLTMRKVNDCGFWSTKTREWNQKPQLLEWKNSWFDAQNRAYARNGLNIHVDPRTLKVQQAEAVERGDLKTALQLERTPEIHIGRNDWRTKQSRFQKNQQITRDNRDAVTDFSQKLRSFDALQSNATPQAPLKSPSSDHRALTEALRDWKLSKQLYGDYAAPDRPMGYWQSLRNLINTIPLEKRAGTFPKPNFDLPPLQSKNKRSTAKFIRPKSNQPPLFSKLDLHDLFKRHADHLTFAEKVRLALSYSDAIANIRAGRSHQLQMMNLKAEIRKTHQKAWQRHQNHQLRRFRARQRLKIVYPNKNFPPRK